MKDDGKGYVLKVRVTLFREGSEDGHAFGRGIYMLLRGIRDTGSLNRTAKSMGCLLYTSPSPRDCS